MTSTINKRHNLGVFHKKPNNCIRRYIKKVRIAEELADILKLLHMAMEVEYFEIYEAANGDVGLEMARHPSPDVVLLDIMTPGTLSGLKVCRCIMANPALKHTKVIMLRARGQAEEGLDGMKAGADAYPGQSFQHPAGIGDWLQTGSNQMTKFGQSAQSHGRSVDEANASLEAHLMFQSARTMATPLKGIQEIVMVELGEGGAALPLATHYQWRGTLVPLLDLRCAVYHLAKTTPAHRERGEPADLIGGGGCDRTGTRVCRQHCLAAPKQRPLPQRAHHRRSRKASQLSNRGHWAQAQAFQDNALHSQG